MTPRLFTADQQFLGRGTAQCYGCLDRFTVGQQVACVYGSAARTWQTFVCAGCAAAWQHSSPEDADRREYERLRQELTVAHASLGAALRAFLNFTTPQQATAGLREAAECNRLSPPPKTGPGCNCKPGTCALDQDGPMDEWENATRVVAAAEKVVQSGPWNPNAQEYVALEEAINTYFTGLGVVPAKDSQEPVIDEDVREAFDQLLQTADADLEAKAVTVGLDEWARLCLMLGELHGGASSGGETR